MTPRSDDERRQPAIHSRSSTSHPHGEAEQLSDEDLAALVRDLAARNRHSNRVQDWIRERPSDDEPDDEPVALPHAAAWPPSLDPIVMPPPPPVKVSLLPDLTIIAKLIGALGITATLGLVVLNLLQLPGLNSVTITAESSQSSLPASPALQGFTRIAPAEARDAVVEPRPGSELRTMDSFNAMLPPAVLPSPEPVSRGPVSPAPEVRQRASAKAAPDAVASATSPGRDEIRALLKRGQGLIAAGDIPSARLILTRLADMGVAEASYAMAQTYDIAVLSRLRVIGIQPDASRANAWYAKAAAQGSVEARRLVLQTADR